MCLFLFFQDVANKNNVNSIPTTLFFYQGRKIAVSVHLAGVANLHIKVRMKLLNEDEGGVSFGENVHLFKSFQLKKSLIYNLGSV